MQYTFHLYLCVFGIFCLCFSFLSFIFLLVAEWCKYFCAHNLRVSQLCSSYTSLWYLVQLLPNICLKNNTRFNLGLLCFYGDWAGLGRGATIVVCEVVTMVIQGENGAVARINIELTLRFSRTVEGSASEKKTALTSGCTENKVFRWIWAYLQTAS